MQNVTRAWAMRTSRNNPSDRSFIATELRAGRLRQGWGTYPKQDLRLVRSNIANPEVGWAGLSDEEKSAWGHWRMLGENAAWPDDTMQRGDIVLVPNVPSDGEFTLCRLVGPYRYEPDPTLEDFGHIRDVEVLTPDAVAFTHPLVSSGLRRSLKCRSRLWWIGDHGASLAEQLAAAASGAGGSLRLRSDPSVHARARVYQTFREGLDHLTTKIEAPLSQALQAAEWEAVLRDALVPLMREVEVRHTGGPSERGADLEIHIPNPFSPAEPWIVAVQMKDYDGEIGSDVAAQMEEAILARRGNDTPGTGHLVAVVLACTRAAPSAALSEKLKQLSSQYGLPVTCTHGKDLMRVITRGLFMGYRNLP